MVNYLWVAIGGALGSVFRFGLSNLAAHSWGSNFPWGTLFINITGSFAICFFGTLTGSDGRWLVSPGGRLFFMTGICGGYTTFSAFSLQTLDLAQDGRWFYAGAYTVASVVLCLLAAWLGHAAASTLNMTKGN
jgi:fluoride exporter